MSEVIDPILIGKSLKNLRLSKHYTQEYLADLVGYSVRNLRRIENVGTKNIEVINIFARVFEVSIIDILNGCFLFIKNIYKIKKYIARFLYTILLYDVLYKNATVLALDFFNTIEIDIIIRNKGGVVFIFILIKNVLFKVLKCVKDV